MAIEKKFVNDGYVKASMDEYFAEQLNRAGYGGMDLNRTPMGTQIIIYSEKPGMVIGKAGKVIRKLTRDVAIKYNLENPQIDAQEVKRPELNAQMMAGWYFRKAGHNTLRAVMNAGALGCEVVISGKLTGARSRVEKFVNGYIKHSGNPVEEVVDEGFAVAIKKLGTLGCKVRIIQPDVVLPDSYRIKELNEIVAEQPAIKPAEKPVEKPAEAPKKGRAAKPKASPAVPKKIVEKVVEEIEVAELEEAEEPQAEASEDIEEAELIYVEGSEEVRRQVNGVWQHKHESYDYWHPMARVHKEARE
jgi:small subunit ribosomal protein S3